MAAPRKLTDKKVERTIYPSAFGSHRSMVVQELSNNMVICEDNGGQYTTESWRLDCGLADPNRYAGRDSWRLGK